jgi:hypothetical protein
MFAASERARPVGRAPDCVDPSADVSPRERLKARAAALGMLATHLHRSAEKPSEPVGMDRILRMTAGWGPLIDAIIDEDRERL